MRVFLSILFFIFLIACQDKVEYKKPEGFIGKAKMIDLLYDMHLVVGTSNVQNINLEKNRDYMHLVYEKYGIDSTQFAASNLYYTAHVQDYEEILEEVEKKIASLQKLMEPEDESTERFAKPVEKETNKETEEKEANEGILKLKK